MKPYDLEGFTCFTSELNVSHSPLSEFVNYLVLESDSSPEYYARNNFPPTEKHLADRHLYLVVKKPIICFQDNILRISFSLRQKLNLSLRAYPGQMTFRNKTHQCIRVSAKDIKELPQLIKEFESVGIEFVSDIKISSYTSQIIYKKYIEYVELEEGVYRDNNNENRYFFKAPRLIEYNEFSSAMDQIKKSCEYNLFDTFLGYLLGKQEVTDFIGIYSDHCEHDRFKELKEEIDRRF